MTDSNECAAPTLSGIRSGAPCLHEEKQVSGEPYFERDPEAQGKAWMLKLAAALGGRPHTLD